MLASYGQALAGCRLNRKILIDPIATGSSQKLAGKGTGVRVFVLKRLSSIPSSAEFAVMPGARLKKASGEKVRVFPKSTRAPNLSPPLLVPPAPTLNSNLKLKIVSRGTLTAGVVNS